MYVLLQVYPAEAAANNEPDDQCCLDVIAVGASEAELERYLADYRLRYEAAVAEFDGWDDMSKDWTQEHDWMLEECARKHQVCGSLIAETWFKIVKVLDAGPARAPQSQSPAESAAA
jgi:hypothetical protein